jgi:hypothetical protein
VKGFTDTLRMELIAEGAPVSVTLVKPASVDTPLPNRARNYMDRQPTLPPPIYPPQEVANAILHAAVHPQRDAYDEFAPAIIALQKRGEPPRDPLGALHAPVRAGEERGDPPVPVMRTSAYTRATLHPLASAGVAAGLAATAAVVLGSLARGRRML